MSEKRRNPRNEKPISLKPLTVEEALRRAMNAKPEKNRKAESKADQGQDRQAPKKKPKRSDD